MSEGTNHEINEVLTHPDWPEIIGPFYEIDGKKNVLSFCRKSWQEGKIPFLFGRKQIGKTGILTPYLKSALGEGVVVFEQGSLKLHDLTEIPQNTIFIAAVEGKDRTYYEAQCNNQIENICEASKLFAPEMFQEREVTLEVNDGDVDNMVTGLGLDTRKLGIKYIFEKHVIVSAFNQQRPISKGVRALEELLAERSFK